MLLDFAFNCTLSSAEQDAICRTFISAMSGSHKKHRQNCETAQFKVWIVENVLRAVPVLVPGPSTSCGAWQRRELLSEIVTENFMSFCFIYCFTMCQQTLYEAMSFQDDKTCQHLWSMYLNCCTIPVQNVKSSQNVIVRRQGNPYRSWNLAQSHSVFCVYLIYCISSVSVLLPYQNIALLSHVSHRPYKPNIFWKLMSPTTN